MFYFHRTFLKEWRTGSIREADSYEYTWNTAFFCWIFVTKWRTKFVGRFLKNGHAFSLSIFQFWPNKFSRKKHKNHFTAECSENGISTELFVTESFSDFSKKGFRRFLCYPIIDNNGNNQNAGKRQHILMRKV